MAWASGSRSFFIFDLVRSLIIIILKGLRSRVKRARNTYGKQLQQENQENTANTFDIHLKTMHSFDVLLLEANCLVSRSPLL